MLEGDHTPTDYPIFNVFIVSTVCSRAFLNRLIPVCMFRFLIVIFLPCKWVMYSTSIYNKQYEMLVMIKATQVPKNRVHDENGFGVWIDSGS